MKKSVAYTLLAIFLSLYITEAIVPDFKSFSKNLPSKVPTPDQLLEWLLNVTYSEVIKVAKAFKFAKVDPSKISYLQYSKDGSYNEVNHLTASVDLSQPIKFVIHGWQSSGDASWVKSIAQSYHKNGIKNTYAVDWKTFAKENYLAAAMSTKEVGEQTAKFVYNLVKKDKSKLKNIHVIGHSLGAQCAGFVGSHIVELSNGTMIGRITALDAAAPLFEFPIRVPSNLRISEQDAEFVDGIHTNAGLLGFFGGFGNQDHYIDFGGPIQSGCLNALNIFDSLFCSHQKAHTIFNNTIVSKDFVSTNCNGPLLLLANKCSETPKVILGEHNNATYMDGTYFIQVTADSQPAEKKKGLLDNVLNVLGNIG